MKELDVVELIAELKTLEGDILPKGSQGTIVHKFNTNEYLVEFSKPQCVPHIYSGFLKLVHSYEFHKNNKKTRE